VNTNRVIDRFESEIMANLPSMERKSVPEVRATRRTLSKQIEALSGATVIELALRLLQHRGFVPRFVGYELVHYHKQAMASLNSRNITALGNGIDDWVAVDTFGCYLSGPAWREHQIPDSLVEKWSRSKDRWWRRAAIVSTVPLNNKARGGKGDVDRTLQICRLVMDDRDDMVVKALSWALRELSKREPIVVRDFLAEYDSRLAPRVLREVKTKLITGVKTPKRNTK